MMSGAELADWLDELRSERWRWFDASPLRLVPMQSERIVHPMAYAEDSQKLPPPQGQPEHATGQVVDASPNERRESP